MGACHATQSNAEQRAGHAVDKIDNDRADIRTALGGIYTFTVYQTVATDSNPLNRDTTIDHACGNEPTRGATTPIELGAT